MWHNAFVTFNCAAASGALLESDLFGHERGAFTGAIQSKAGLVERANGGTLVLDAIDELTMELQMKLLRLLETGHFDRVGGTQSIQVDVRLIALTNKDLHAQVQANRFQEDLLYRLNVISLEIPPLRERTEDIPLLTDYFLKKYAAQSNRAGPTIAPEAMEVLMSYDWPGNVREFASVIERAVVLCDDGTIRVEHLPLPHTPSVP